MTKFTKANWMTRALQEKLNVVGEYGREYRTSPTRNQILHGTI